MQPELLVALLGLIVAFVALIISALALWVARTDFSRANNVHIKILDASHSGFASVEEGYHERFRFMVRNLGIPVHNIFMTLAFYERDGHGSCSLPLRSRTGEPNKGEFAKGMTTEFLLLSGHLDVTAHQMLSNIVDLKKQDVRLILHSNGYQAWTFRFAGGLMQQLSERWSYAYRLSPAESFKHFLRVIKAMPQPEKSDPQRDVRHFGPR